MPAVIHISAESGDPYMVIAAPGADIDDEDDLHIDTRVGLAIHVISYGEDVTDGSSQSVSVGIPISNLNFFYQFSDGQGNQNWNGLDAMVNDVGWDVPNIFSGKDIAFYHRVTVAHFFNGVIQETESGVLFAGGNPSTGGGSYDQEFFLSRDGQDTVFRLWGFTQV